MDWLARNLPTLFILAPDGTTHWRFKGYYIYKDIECIYGTNKVFIFKNEFEYIYKGEVLNNINIQKGQTAFKIKELVDKQREIESVNEEKDKRISVLEENFSKIEIEKHLLEDAYGENLGEVINLKREISRLEGILESKKEEKKELKEWFDSEINNREELIKSLRETINKFREELNSVANNINVQNSINIEKLKKEFEMLDKDFVDVAKAMGIFSNEEGRPKRGFRIKL